MLTFIKRQVGSRLLVHVPFYTSLTWPELEPVTSRLANVLQPSYCGGMHPHTVLCPDLSGLDP